MTTIIYGSKIVKPKQEYPEPNFTVYVYLSDNHETTHSEGCHNVATAKAVAERLGTGGRRVTIYQKGVGFVQDHPVWGIKQTHKE